MVLTLDECLKQNGQNLGADFFHLGRKVGYGCLNRRKVLLSYKERSGWKIVFLNPLQLFFRRFFSAYKSTYFNHIFFHLNAIETKEGATEKCFIRIQDLWIKKHLRMVGNSEIGSSAAEVVCFAERHLDEVLRSAFCRLIDQHYRKGDVILVEGLEAEKRKPLKKLFQTKYVKIDGYGYGWEPKDFEKLSRALLENRRQYRLLSQSLHHIKRKIPHNHLTEEEIRILEKEIELLIKKIFLLSRYYKGHDPSFAQKSAQLIQAVFLELKNGLSSGKNLLYVVAKIFAELENEKERALYRNMKETDFQEIIRGAPRRNASLIQQIEKARNENKRVFVIGGAAHFLQVYPKEKDNTSQAVRNALQKYKFTIISKKGYTSLHSHFL